MTCKTFRKSLISAIFKSFNFTSYIYNRNYTSYIVTEDEVEEYEDLSDNEEINESGDEGDETESEHSDDYEHYDEYRTENSIGKKALYRLSPYNTLNIKFGQSIEQFKLDLKNFPGYPKHLILRCCKDFDYLLYNIPNIFSNIVFINISVSQIQIEVFQSLLDNLVHLDNLSISNNYFLKHYKNLNQDLIKWPNNLKKLKFRDNYTTCVNNNKIRILDNTGFIHNTILNYFQLSSICLPKLISLEYLLNGRESVESILLNFLKLNPQIKHLKIKGYISNTKLFNAIKYVECLNYLDLTELRFSGIQYKLNELPSINTVARLDISLTDCINNVESVIKMFSNLNELSIEAHDYGIGKLNILTMKILNIKSLSLKIFIKNDPSITNEFTFPELNNLKGLEFILNPCSFKSIEWNVCNCSNLKLVKFTSYQDHHQDSFNQLDLSSKLKSDWNIVYFPHKLLFFRIEK